MDYFLTAIPMAKSDKEYLPAPLVRDGIPLISSFNKEFNIMKSKIQTPFTQRQYMLSQHFEIYYYSDTGHHNVEMHAHDYYEFYFYMEGDVEFEIGDRRQLLKNGDFVIVPPGAMHRAYVRDTSLPYRRFVFWISSDYAGQLAERFPDFEFLLKYMNRERPRHIFHNDPVSFNAILSKTLQLLEEIHGSGYGRHAVIEIRVEDLLMLLCRTVYDKVNPSAHKTSSRLHEQVMAYIDHNPEEDITLGSLAERFYVSKYHIAHTFKEHLGISVHQYLLKKRLSACRDALLMNEKISEVCLSYGFKDYPSFFRAFRKEYGMSPKEYKEAFSLISLQNEG